MKEAIILAGGLGTRLKHIVPDLPKSMAPVRNRPFMEYLLHYLNNHGIARVVIAAGYKHEALLDFFGSAYHGIELAYSVEDKPLGTGGAILKAAGLVDAETFLVLNGDTFFDVAIEAFERHHLDNDPVLSVALKPMRNFTRYGTVMLDDRRIRSFNEKQYCDNGLINGGVYILKKEWLIKASPGAVFSFEKDIMERRVDMDVLTGYISDTYFIDIGIPEDYYRASEELPDLVSR